jgi:hypothetical protein
MKVEIEKAREKEVKEQRKETKADVEKISDICWSDI